MNTVRKPIGVCLAQAHTALKTELVGELDRAARENGCGIVAFNSSLTITGPRRATISPPVSMT